MKIVAILQARFSSTRLPGKVLMPLGGSTVLGQVAARVRTAPGLDAVWVATSSGASDDAVAGEAARVGVPCFRGSLEDVLGRYHAAAAMAGADAIVRVTCDCPLFDGDLLGRMLAEFRRAVANNERVDYLSNVLQRTFPRGLDAEIFTRSALDRVHAAAMRNYDREHVTPYFYSNPELFALRSFTSPTDFSVHRWTLDTADDWRFVQAVYSEFAGRVRQFTTEEVLELVERRPELRLFNAHVAQKTDVAVARHPSP